MKYRIKTMQRRKPVQAIQYNLENLNSVIGFAGSNNVLWKPRAEELSIISLGRTMRVDNGSYVVKRYDGELFIIGKRAFERAYEKVER